MNKLFQPHLTLSKAQELCSNSKFSILDKADIRNLRYDLKMNTELAALVNSNSISIDQLLDMPTKDRAITEIKELRQRYREENLKKNIKMQITNEDVLKVSNIIEDP